MVYWWTLEQARKLSKLVNRETKVIRKSRSPEYWLSVTLIPIIMKQRVMRCGTGNVLLCFNKLYWLIHVSTTNFHTDRSQLCLQMSEGRDSACNFTNILTLVVHNVITNRPFLFQRIDKKPLIRNLFFSAYYESHSGFTFTKKERWRISWNNWKKYFPSWDLLSY